MIGSNIRKDYYADVVSLRAKLVSDMHMIRRLDLIATRKRQMSVVNSDKSFKLDNNLSESVLKNSYAVKSVKKQEKEKEKFKSNNLLPHIKSHSIQGNNKTVGENMKDSKMRRKNLRNEYIYKDNVSFAKRLYRIKSPLSKDSMNESFRQHNEYKEITKKVKKFNDLRRSISHMSLPPLTLRGGGDIRKLLNI